MPLVPFAPPAGLVNDGTAYTAKGRWYNGNLVRFKEGFPQKMGGWVNTGLTGMVGICRDAFVWEDLTYNTQMFFGTSWKAYTSTDLDGLVDITPIRVVDNLGTNPFSVHSGQTTMTVTDTANGAIQNDFVTFSGASGFAGITAGQLNQQFQITSIIDANTYTVTLPVAATSTTTGGGTIVVATYQITTGANAQALGGGWGAGPWSRGTWGSFYSSASVNQLLRLWSSSNFGQDLIFCPRGFPIFYWKANSLPPAVNVSTLTGASDAPVGCNYVLVAPQAQQLIAFGVNPIGSPTIDPLLIRWSAEGSAANWTPSITNAAGELRVSLGSQILCAQVAMGQILVWTESSLHALIYVGGDLIYGLQTLSPNIDLLGPNAAVTTGDFAMWMGRQNFYIFDGQVRTLPCSVRQYVFGNINLGQAYKIFGVTNRLHREIWFFYPSANSNECDSYVCYNYADQCWYFGSMARTAWFDAGIINFPIAVDPTGNVFFMENGFDDGSVSPAVPIDAYITSGPMELGAGDHFSFVRRIIPDLNFFNSTNTAPTINYSIQTQDYPGGQIIESDSNILDSTCVVCDQYTTKLDVRMRGRHFNIKVESNSQTGVNWRLGVQRFEVVPDGQR